MFGALFMMLLLVACPGTKKNPSPGGDVGSKVTEEPTTAPQVFEIGPIASVDVDKTIQEVSPEDLNYPESGEIAFLGELPFTGRSTTFYTNGQRATMINYINGKRHGIEARWFKDGGKRFEGRFQENTLVGVFEEWYQNGRRKSQAVWQDGKRRSVTEWDENGNLIRQ